MQLPKFSCVSLGFVGLLAVALLGVGLWTGAGGTGGGGENSSWFRNAVQEASRAGRLRADQEFLARERADLEAIHADLAERRTSIREAVGALRAVNARRPQHLRFRADTFYPGDAEDEQLARLAVRSACNWAQVQRPQSSAQVCSRLGAELRAYLDGLKAGSGRTPPARAPAGAKATGV